MLQSAMAGSERVFEADAVVIAFGFNASPAPWFADQGIEVDEWGLVKASEQDRYAFQTTNPKVFAAGDMARGQSLVVWAIADGRRVATGVDAFLRRDVHRAA